MILKLVYLILAFSAFTVDAKPALLPIKACTYETPFGIIADGKLLCREGLLINYHEVAKIPIAVTYTLEKSEISTCAERDSSFSVDSDLPKKSASTTKDYYKSGFDMGHMANAADFKWSFDAQAGVALLSNIAPQHPTLNRGFWRALEDQTRSWAIARGPLVVITGPIYKKSKLKIGNGVVVPTAFFKVIYDPATNSAVSFIAQNDGRKETFSTSLSTIPAVERATGLKMPLPKDAKSTKIWTKVSLKFKNDVCLRR